MLSVYKMVAIQVCDLLHFWRPEAPYRLIKKDLKINSLTLHQRLSMF